MNCSRDSRHFRGKFAGLAECSRDENIWLIEGKNAYMSVCDSSSFYKWTNRGVSTRNGCKIAIYACAGCRAIRDKIKDGPQPPKIKFNVTKTIWEISPTDLKDKHFCLPFQDECPIKEKSSFIDDIKRNKCLFS